MTTVLRLAEQLAALDDERVTALVDAAQLTPDGIDDVFDLAEALLAPDAVQRRLGRLDRSTLAALAAAAAIPDHDDVTATSAVSEVAAWLARSGSTDVEVVDIAAKLETAGRLALLDPLEFGTAELGTKEAGDIRVGIYPSVAERLAAWSAEGLPDLTALASEPAPTALAAVPRPDDAPGAAERASAQTAFETVATVADVLAELDRAPARELAKGGIGLPDRGRLAQAAHRDRDTVVVALDLAEDAGLIDRTDQIVRPSAEATAWMDASSVVRWGHLSASWLAAIPDPVRRVLVDRAFAGWSGGLRDHLAWLYPAAERRSGDRLDRALREAVALGLAAANTPTALGHRVLHDGADGARELAAELFPDEVDRVYLQHDLTVVAPGPLTPAVDSRLRQLADMESRTPATTFRITAASIARALTSGETEESLRRFLASVSLTGVPQPLDYLIGDRASRLGRVRVEDAAPGRRGHRSVIRSDDADLAAMLEVDSELDSLALQRIEPGVLGSRATPDAVRSALDRANYPVAIDRPIAPPRKSPTSGSEARASRPPRADRVHTMLERVRRNALHQTGGEAWTSRQLAAAVRSRSAVILTVAMPDGRLTEHLVEPTGISGGRLRARDRAADMERTVPLASIRGVRSP